MINNGSGIELKIVARRTAPTGKYLRINRDSESLELDHE